ncbi:G-patch domain [Dillenia turbinata]|uniref:G-patch domain n=1 Tax=Dillenia turbinata TaxID=194707 RepID=A0AAN8W549_9MAGN
MGYNPGSALGKEGPGRAKPVGLEIQGSCAGIGSDDAHKEKKRKVEIKSERKRKEETLMEDFARRQKSQWHSPRVVANFSKAKGALDQLEGKEFAKPMKNEDGEEDGQEEEETLKSDKLKWRHTLTKKAQEHISSTTDGLTNIEANHDEV